MRDSGKYYTEKQKVLEEGDAADAVSPSSCQAGLFLRNYCSMKKFPPVLRQSSDFPENLSQVHFIKLVLKNEKGEDVSSNFYWRSKDKYEGKETLTGPATSGFEDLNQLEPARVKTSCKVRQENGRLFADVTVKNISRRIAFFNQLQFLDADGAPVRPAFYSDNFFSLFPGEKKTVTIDTEDQNLNNGLVLKIKGWNIKAEKRILR